MVKNNDLLFKFNNELRNIVELVFDNKFYYKNLKQAFVTYSFGKAYKTHASVVILCQRGNGQDAGILSRSLFELAVTALYILKDSTDDRIQRWFDYDWVVRDRMYKYAQSEPRFTKALQIRAENPKTGDNSIEEIAIEAKKMQDKHHFVLSRGWSDKSIYGMAKEVGLESVYSTVYNLQSGLHHSGVRTVNDYFKLEGDGIRADTGPSQQWIEETLVSSFHFFLIVADKWNEIFKLGLDSKLKEIEERYVNEVGERNKEANDETTT